ncbi:MAG TPA: hypothetical protein DDZ91_11560 [Firmicutes bacterium]|jgi:hypothetical protein|nr:hypothetical protein [Bacillota bacterium]
MTKEQARDLTARAKHDVKIWTNECTACEHDYYRAKGALQEAAFMLTNAALVFGESKIIEDTIKEIENENDMLDLMLWSIYKVKEEQR